jgi:hypothetical protein
MEGMTGGGTPAIDAARRRVSGGGVSSSCEEERVELTVNLLCLSRTNDPCSLRLGDDVASVWCIVGEWDGEGADIVIGGLEITPDDVGSDLGSSDAD